MENINILLLVGAVLGLIGVVVISVIPFTAPSNWKWYRRLRGGKWVYTTTHFAPGIPMASFSSWERADKAWVGKGCGSYSSVEETEDYTKYKK